MARKKRIISLRDLIIFYKKTFATPEGKQVLYDLMGRHHVLNSHKGEEFKEGQRSVVLEIMKKCSINLEEFDKILKGETE